MGSRYPIKRKIDRYLLGGAGLAIVAMLPPNQALSEESTPSPEPRLGVELNKLEQQGEDCVIWTVFENQLDTDFESLKLELVLFDADGLIQRRLALNAAPLPAAKTMVKVFKVPAMRCDGLGRVLVNDAVACVGTNGAVDDCIDKLRLSSRTEVSLFK